MRIAAATSLTLISLALAACGEEENHGATVIPAAGKYAQTDATTPGVPPGSSYDITAAEWLKLSDHERLSVATDYVAANDDPCHGISPGGKGPEGVRNYADVSAGSDYPLTAPVAELLAEGCAAVQQSGADSNYSG